MRFLFLHPNFPGQFKNICCTLAEDGHEVVFLCQYDHGRKLPGVKRACIKSTDHNSGGMPGRGKGESSKVLLVAEKYRRAMASLADDGYKPDVIVSHSGWGCGLHASVVWPDVRRVAYVEWWFGSSSPLHHYHPIQEYNLSRSGYNPGERRRNMYHSLELAEADTIVAPTEWQRAQLPKIYRKNCMVVHDGIDVQKFIPAPSQKSPVPLLTYGTRGMEPARGFPDLVEALPAVLRTYPDLIVQIAGSDKVNYGPKFKENAEGHKSYGAWAQHRLKKWINEGRVSFIGSMAYPQYRRWLQSSWYHIYLTQPYIASWSLLEAMASGCALIASNVPPVREFLSQHEGWLVDHRNPDWLASSLKQLKSATAMRQQLGEHARRRSVHYDYRKTVEQWKIILGTIGFEK